eukprot:9471349-Pyramimonas_sp.AAC.1
MIVTFASELFSTLALRLLDAAASSSPSSPGASSSPSPFCSPESAASAPAVAPSGANDAEAAEVRVG